jgi:signal transduction histidine kinase
LSQYGALALWRNGSENPREIISEDSDVICAEELGRMLKDSETARMDLSRRMINAQEVDRTRLARELHDDIGQSLAILKLRMLQCVRSSSDHSARASSDLEELAERLDAVIRKVNLLSHDLHSSALEFLGLATAVKRHCMECSEQLRVPIQCYCQGVEKDLDNAVALALFRIVQEGIHNAIKHSRATKMLVRIIARSRDLSLEISDNGVGFDVEEEGFGEGLGLISMRERACLIGGECKILSSAGRGTRIVVHAPIPPRRFDTRAEIAIR